VAKPPGAEGAHAGMADAHPAAERELEPRLLSRDKDWLGAVALRLGVAFQESDRSALAPAGPVAADDRLKALHMEAVGQPLLLPALLERVQHLGRSTEKGVALAPVRAELVEIGRGEPPVAAARVLL